MEGKGSYFDAVQEGNARVITTTGTIKAVIKNPSPSVMELDPDETQSAGYI